MALRNLLIPTSSIATEFGCGGPIDQSVFVSCRGCDRFGSARRNPCAASHAEVATQSGRRSQYALGLLVSQSILPNEDAPWVLLIAVGLTWQLANPQVSKANGQLDLTGRALVVVDPQVDFLSTKGATWKLVGKTS